MFTLVRNVMRRNVIAVAPGDTIALAVQTMLWSGARHLPVVQGTRLEGVISERDVLRFRAESALDVRNEPVSKAMSSPAQYIDPDESMSVAAERMAACKIGCLPVLERGALIGIITTTDILHAQLSRGAPEPEVSQGEPLGWSAKDVMTPHPVVARPEEYLVDAVAKMVIARVRHLPVVDEDDRVIGMLSDRDVRLHADGVAGTEPLLRDRRIRVREVMSTDVITVSPGAGPPLLLAAFTDWRIGALPVVGADRRLLGVVSYIDILQHFAKTAARVAA